MQNSMDLNEARKKEGENTNTNKYDHPIKD